MLLVYMSSAIGNKDHANSSIRNFLKSSRNLLKQYPYDCLHSHKFEICKFLGKCWIQLDKSIMLAVVERLWCLSFEWASVMRKPWKIFFDFSIKRNKIIFISKWRVIKFCWSIQVSIILAHNKKKKCNLFFPLFWLLLSFLQLQARFKLYENT